MSSEKQHVQSKKVKSTSSKIAASKKKASPRSIVDKYLDKRKVPKWFRGYSTFQIKAAEELQHAIRDDIEQNTTLRVRQCLQALGIEPIGSTKDLKFLMKLSGGNDLAFLWFLMEMHYKTHGERYSLNEQLIMSTIAHLDMVFTLRGLDKILPPGHLNKADLKKQEMLKRKKEEARLRRENREEVIKHEIPYFNELVRPKLYGKSLIAHHPSYQVQFRLYNVYTDPNYVCPNGDNRWFSFYDCSVGRRVSHQVVNEIIDEMFADLDLARAKADKIRVVCQYHKRQEYKEFIKKGKLRLARRFKILDMADIDRYQKEKRRERILKEIDEEVGRCICKNKEKPPFGLKCQAKRTVSTCDFDFIVENVEDISTSACTCEEVIEEASDTDTESDSSDSESSSDSDIRKKGKRKAGGGELSINQQKQQTDVLCGHEATSPVLSNGGDFSVECYQHYEENLQSEDFSARLSGGGGPAGDYRNYDKTNKKSRSDDMRLHGGGSGTEKCKGSARDKKSICGCCQSNSDAMSGGGRSQLDDNTTAFFDRYFQKRLSSCLEAQGIKVTGRYSQKNIALSEKRHLKRKKLSSVETGTGENTVEDEFWDEDIEDEPSYHDICSSGQISFDSPSELAFYERFKKPVEVYDPGAIDEYFDCKEKELYDLLSFKHEMPTQKKDKYCIKKEWKPCKNLDDIHPSCEPKFSSKRAVKKTLPPSSEVTDLSSSSKASCMRAGLKHSLDFVHLLDGPVKLKSPFHSSQKSVSTDNYVRNKHPVPCSMQCGEKHTNKYFTAPRPHWPHNFNYFEIFKLDKLSLEEKEKAKRKGDDIYEQKSEPDIRKMIVDDLRRKQKKLYNLDYIFQCKSDEECVSAKDLEGSELQYPLNLGEIAHKCADRIWQNQVDQYSESQEFVYSDYDSPLAKKYPKKFYDCSDKKLMIQMLKDAFEYLSQDHRYVLAGMPDSHNFPFLLEWIQRRYGKVYFPEDRRNSYRNTLQLFNALDKAPITVILPSVKDIGTQSFVSYDCRDYLLRKTKQIKQKFYDHLDSVIMEHARIFWYAIRPFLCPNGPPRNTYFAYMPSKLKDITRLRPWRSSEYNDCKAARERYRLRNDI
ncbi:uncharacterized protein LOC119680617 [Teleopsis dalmanni]|uniref:uncharacterized protein LOC119680617 n=1 Tax=Teleopsis dalmanni TaxID=139649 RepID=UPI0018CF1DC9|nr:uncharacterized protein LOC119680617 [Teleopsis dalmanni]